MHDLSWKKKYELGHPSIDQEHKHLFEIASEAFKPVIPTERKKKIRETIVELNEYMKLHFSHEESYMRVIQYPYFKQHELVHKVIIEKMNTMLKTLSSMSIKEFEKELAFFIDSALVGHILEEDTKIHEWYKNKKGQRHIIFKDIYLLGNEEIDIEHKALFDIANEAFSISEQTGNHKEQVKEIIIRLSSYIKKHFEHEENLMKEIAYPGLLEHHGKHEKIIKEMHEFVKKMANMDVLTFELELAIFIERWVVQHVIHEDKKIKYFIESDEPIGVIDLEDIT